MTNSLRTAIAFVVATIFGASAASAQSGREIDVSAGLMHVGEAMRGATVQVATEVAPGWSIVGEADWSKGRDCSDCDPVYKDIAVLGGARTTFMRDRRVSPFAQVLGGVLHSRAAGYFYDSPFPGADFFEEGYMINYVAIQPGGGLTAMLTPRIGLMVQGDLQLAVSTHSEYTGATVFPRVVAGAVIRFGGSR